MNTLDEQTLAAFKENIMHHDEYDDYIKWMSCINGRKPSISYVETLTPDRLIGGYCEDFGVYFAYKYDIDLFFLDNEHDLLWVNDRFYDGFNVEGVDSLDDLEFIKIYSKDKEHKLVIDEEWKSYHPLTSNLFLIEKFKKF